MVKRKKEQGPWLERPPTGALWTVEDSLHQLAGLGAPIGKRANKSTQAFLNQALAICNDEQFWARMPRQIGAFQQSEFRNQFRAAIDMCRGFN